jgi:Polysaccharide deacetylase
MEGIFTQLPPNTKVYGQASSLYGFNNNSRNDTNKVVVLNFYDNPKSQFTVVKPILDKYGFKASFFVVCNWAGSSDKRMSWQDIMSLQNENQDIESHTMGHRNLDNLSSSELTYEVAQSKKCLADHGIKASIFAPPDGNDWKNATVIDTISKYYDLATGGFSELMFLHCDGYKIDSSQTDCRTYFDNGSLTFVNRYSIREWSHNAADVAFSFNASKIFEKFVEEIRDQANSSTVRTLNAIPIIAYHSIDNNKTRDSTGVNLFAEEMKYLHDNGFKVLTMSNLGFNENGNYLYIKNE